MGLADLEIPPHQLPIIPVPAQIGCVQYDDPNGGQWVGWVIDTNCGRQVTFTNFQMARALAEHVLKMTGLTVAHELPPEGEKLPTNVTPLRRK